ncbi:hypothetical protein [Dyadobacter chenhuakuii]|uniref:Uncharacterized protein n=1 Tax=Dyadobacter chenhuakuii TaxID=2909339 RepID=A0ABY5EB50_9BACT|nr:hypothetical protein [Dyadobacter chenhuakuii]UTM21808.1 hypothetical protein NFI80_25375 [Dyadobacter chenhuakuii]
MKSFLVCMLVICGAWPGSCQFLNKPVFDFARLNDIPEIDSIMDISSLNESAYNKLIDRMYTLDQKYRIKVMKGWSSKRNPHPRDQDPKTLRDWQLMAINDQSIQALFLRLLKLYKWPTQTGEQGSAVKAWYIAWHAPARRKKLFYPFIVEAVKDKSLGSKTLAPFRKSMY